MKATIDALRGSLTDVLASTRDLTRGRRPFGDVVVMCLHRPPGGGPSLWRSWVGTNYVCGAPGNSVSIMFVVIFPDSRCDNLGDVVFNIAVAVTY